MQVLTITYLMQVLTIFNILNAGIDYGGNTGLWIDPVSWVHPHPLQQPATRS